MRARTRPIPPVRLRASRRGGSILVVVLVTLLFASVALTLFIEKASDDLLVESRVAAARRLRFEAYSALETTLAVLQDFQLVNGSLRSPAEGWGSPLEWAGYGPAEGRVVTVEFVDESGKLSLPHITANTLVDLFKSWEIAPNDAEKLSDALLQWMNPDYVPTSSFQPDYENDPLPYVAPARPLRSFSELAAIDAVRDAFYDADGRPNAYWKRFTEAVSLLDFTQSNLNALRPGVLAAYGFDSNQQAQLGDFSPAPAITNPGAGLFPLAGRGRDDPGSGGPARHGHQHQRAAHHRHRVGQSVGALGFPPQCRGCPARQHRESRRPEGHHQAAKYRRGAARVADGRRHSRQLQQRHHRRTKPGAVVELSLYDLGNSGKR